MGNILTVAAAALCGPAQPVCAGIASSLASAVVTGLASGDLGQALKAGFISGATAFAMFQVGRLTGHGALDFLSSTHLANIAGHAAVGCASSVASGGECGPGALAGAVGAAASPIVRDFFPNPRMNPDDLVGGTIAHAVIGGVSSVAGGGKFGNGAVTASFGYLFNNLGNLGKAFLGSDAQKTLLDWLIENNFAGGWRANVMVRYPDGSWGFIDLLRSSSAEIYELKPANGTADGAGQVQKYSQYSGYNLGHPGNIPNLMNIPSSGPFAFLGTRYDYMAVQPGLIVWNLSPGQFPSVQPDMNFVSMAVSLFLGRRGGMGSGGVPAR